ncbi:MAG: hypothetical protein C5B51_17960 [Terriglobia bacterium]|nr:MAG: hypothetical protein C5B51_17960 [Terriglobia bacterium]
MARTPTISADDSLSPDWLEYRSKLHERGHRLDEQYAQQKLKGLQGDPEKNLKYLVNLYDAVAKMLTHNVVNHQSAVKAAEELDAFWKPFLSRSLQVIRSRLPREKRAESKDLLQKLRRQLLPRSSHWKAEAHRRARRAALVVPAEPVEDGRPHQKRRGDLSLLEGKKAVRLRTAALYAGVTERRIQQAIKDEKLAATGRKGQRLVAVDSLKLYQPPRNEVMRNQTKANEAKRSQTKRNEI